MRERIFAILAVVGFVVVIDGATWKRHLLKNPGHPYTWILVVDSVVLLLALWADGFFNFFDLW